MEPLTSISSAIPPAFPTHPRFRALRWLFDPESGSKSRFLPRWIFLRALAVIYFSAFYSLLFQIEGLIGPHGILPAAHYLPAVYHHFLSAWHAFRFAPTLFWISSTSRAMLVVTWLGIAASIAAFLNAWPRLSFFVCFVCFLSFVTAAQDFSNYQSDSMLLEAGFLALFFAPRGLWPGLGTQRPTARAALFLLQWEWFRIYFESGAVKLLSGDPEWRHLTAMDDYYQNGPLPTWVGWHVQHLPHWFHLGSAAATLVMELAIVWMLFLPRRARLICFFIVTPWEIGVILTANYTFLNYLVLALGFLLLDDRSITWLLPLKLRAYLTLPIDAPPAQSASISESPADNSTPAPLPRSPRAILHAAAVSVAAFMLLWIAYVTTARMLFMFSSSIPIPSAPIIALEPFRIANQYGLFAVMTRGRYEIEFQGSNDGETWTPYLFRYKPQALNQPPGIYAPYQPRFEWNLWFASLGNWQQNDFVTLAEERLLENDPDVLSLFRSNPFPQQPPRYVKAILWQYWFTSAADKRATGNWWRRELVGLYAPEITRQPSGDFAVVTWPEELPPHD